MGGGVVARSSQIHFGICSRARAEAPRAWPPPKIHCRECIVISGTPHWPQPAPKDTQPRLAFQVVGRSAELAADGGAALAAGCTSRAGEAAVSSGTAGGAVSRFGGLLCAITSGCAAGSASPVVSGIGLVSSPEAAGRGAASAGFGSGLGGRGIGFLAVSIRPLANSITCP